MAEIQATDSPGVCERSPGAQGKVSKGSSANLSTASQANASWLVGDVVWSKIPGHPWWPSMVAYDPNSAVYFRYKGRARYYHVQFFGQEPVRGWASERSVMRFEGRESFEASALGKKQQVAAKRIAHWETAIKVAEKAYPMNRQERQLCFTFKYFDKGKKKGQNKLKTLNGMRPVVQPATITAKEVELSGTANDDSTSITNTDGNKTELKSEEETLKQKVPRKRKRKGPPEEIATSASNSEPKVETSTLKASPVTISPKRKRIRKPKIRDDEIVDKMFTKLHAVKSQIDSIPQTPPRLNGDFPASPVNGEVSPNTLKLKIRKVRPSLDSPEVKKRRGRPPKEKETFIIVNDLEKPESKDKLSKDVLDKHKPLTNVSEKQESKPDVSSTSCNSEDEPKKKKRRQKIEENFSDSNKVTESVKKKQGKKSAKEMKEVKAKELSASLPKGKKQKQLMTKKVAVKKEITPSLTKGKKVKPEETLHNEVTSSMDVVEAKQDVTPEPPCITRLTDIDRSTVSSNDDDTSSVKSSTVAKKKREKPDKEAEAVCTVCEQGNDLMFCEGVCSSAYHPDCIGLSAAPKGKFKCDECTSGIHSCFVCRQTGDVVHCSQPMCPKFFHAKCLQQFKCTKTDGDHIYCPLHFCSTCVMNKTPFGRGKMTRCVRCPTAYHLGCLVAGCMPITSHLMVCEKHFFPSKTKSHHTHVNVNWCFVCSIGGTLICCESCPAAFHPECISYEGIPEGHFFCKDCVEGKALLYGDIVWVKLGMYRWWPALICNPRDVPTNIQAMRHQPGEFPVMFLGTHDYYWIHKGRVFSYQDGDKGTENGTNKYLAKVFKKALVEAKEKYNDWKKARQDKAEQDLQKFCKKPPPYKHVKINKCTTAQRVTFDLSEMPICECTPEHACGPDSNCLNRMLQFECVAAKCPAKDKCQNQRFQKREYADGESFRANARGWGLRTKQEIKKGTFVIEYVGELIDDATCRERVKSGDDDTNYYMLTIDKDCIIDAGPMGNLSRFMNHSCYPNCDTQKWTVNGDVRVGLFASRDIEAMEELTFDYCLECHGNEKKKCHCGAQNCSGFLGVRPKTQNAQLTEDKAKKAAIKRKKRKPKKTVVKEVHEDDCFICGDGGQLIMCDKNGCKKCYHVDCLNLSKKPHGRWLCPWHFCDECGKRATILCCECPNSYCKKHASGQINLVGNKTYLCTDHDDMEHGSSQDEPTTPMCGDQELDTLDLLSGGLPGITAAELDHLPQKPEDLDLDSN